MSTHESQEELRARVRDLEKTLRQNDHNAMVTFRLTEPLSNVLGLLLSLPLVTPDIIQQRLEIATDAKTAVYRLRKRLHKFGIEVHSQRKVGYWLEPDAKERVQQMIADANPQRVSEALELRKRPLQEAELTH